jgi:hypothetical protein
MKKDRLRKPLKRVSDLLLLEYSWHLIVSARDTLDREATTPVVTEESFRVQIETTPYVMTLKLRYFKERNH